MLEILFVAIMLLLLLNLYFFKKQILSPAIIFNSTFIPSIICSMINADKWEFSMNYNTFFVIFGGVIVFSIGCILMNYFMNLNYEKNNKINIKYSYNLEIDKWKLIIMIVYQIFTYILLYKNVKEIGLLYGSGDDISSILYGYQKMVKFSGEQIGLSGVVNSLNIIAYSSGFVWAYLLVLNLVQKVRKNRILLIINFVLAIFGQFLKGDRGDSIALIVAFIVCFIFIYFSIYKQNGKKIKFKYFVYGILCFTTIILIFQSLGNIMGRNNELKLWDYISIYIGAELKNLDSVLNSNIIHSKLWGQETFIYLIHWLGSKFNINSWIEYDLYLPFRNVNGYSLGNVCTTFYPYYLDFGYTGVYICTFIFGSFSQFVFVKSKKNEEKNYRFNFWLILYSYLFYCIFMSFFSNKFYEMFFNIKILKILIVWIFLKWFIIKLKVKF